jgi:hypothetical protein
MLSIGRYDASTDWRSDERPAISVSACASAAGSDAPKALRTLSAWSLTALCASLKRPRSSDWVPRIAGTAMFRWLSS